MAKHIRCRAKLPDTGCYDGSPTSRQFDEDLPMAEDGTYDGATIVCDACYVALMPLTPSGQGLKHELADAIARYPGAGS